MNALSAASATGGPGSAGNLNVPSECAQKYDEDYDENYDDNSDDINDNIYDENYDDSYDDN